jgi:hypothetical protein
MSMETNLPQIKEHLAETEIALMKAMSRLMRMTDAHLACRRFNEANQAFGVVRQFKDRLAQVQMWSHRIESGDVHADELPDMAEGAQETIKMAGLIMPI